MDPSRWDPEAGFAGETPTDYTVISPKPGKFVARRAVEPMPAAPDEDRLSMVLSLGINPDCVPLRRFLPIDLYYVGPETPNPDSAFDEEHALADIVSALFHYF